MVKSAFLVSACCLLGFIGTGCGGPGDDTQPSEGQQGFMMEDPFDPSSSETLATGGAEPTAVFNNPLHPNDQNAIVEHIIELINGAEPGSNIRVAMYAFQDAKVADALIAVNKPAPEGKGVNVRVVVDYSHTRHKDGTQFVAIQKLISQLREDVSRPSYIKICDKDRACVSKHEEFEGGRTINHNKFYLFSSTQGKKDVLIQSSANLNSNNTEDYWNNAVTLSGDEVIYNAYLKYFNKLSQGAHSYKVYNDIRTHGNTRLYLFPYALDQSDPILFDILDRITCKGNTDGYGTERGYTRIRISAHAFANARKKVAEKLHSLAEKDGCYIEIVYNQVHIGSEIKRLLQHDRIKLTHFEGEERIVHSKYLLVEGTYAGHRNSKWVFTGSHNLDEASLSRNDETLLRLRSDRLHDAYAKNFHTMWSAGVHD